MSAWLPARPFGPIREVDTPARRLERPVPVHVWAPEGLPSDFGFPIVVDPADPDSAYVIPLIGAEDRTTPGGSVGVWETRDAGATWTPRTEGLPQQDAYLTVLREAFDGAPENGSLGLYFGATSGDVFCSGDAGATWSTAATHLPPVYSVRVA